MLTVAERVPMAWGLNVTQTLQELPGVTETPAAQALVSVVFTLKSPGSAPPITLTLVIFRFAVPGVPLELLETATDCAALVDPKFVPGEGNVRFADESVAYGPMPVPVTVTICGLDERL